jgi:hypothetical protein
MRAVVDLDAGYLAAIVALHEIERLKGCLGRWT